MNATVRFDTQYHSGAVDRRIFSGFIEHLGRAIYEGIYDPGNPLSNERGFRRDVLDALRPLRMPLIRYPGGNFVSCYDWRDGIGPRQQRPVRPDYAWRSLEPNTFGTDEFIEWCRELESAPMMAVNLGTGTPANAAALLEYCNFPSGTSWSDKRIANGHSQPYGIKTWCLGNEMDGTWQAGHVPAEEYARRADQAGKLMKGLDRSIELVVCGSSGRFMKTYMEWDRQVLEYCWDDIDYISAHRYSTNAKNDSAWYLAEGVEIDGIIDDYAALIGYVGALKKSAKQVYLSFDEWNVWYRTMGQSGTWKTGEHLLEEVYNLEDALVCAQYLNSFVRHADIVKIACLAQIVNVIAPVMTRREGVLLQSIYHPFALFVQYARGLALMPLVNSPNYKAGERGEVPVLDVSATYAPDNGAAAIFLVNRDMKTDLTVEISFVDVRVEKVMGADVLSGSDPKLANTWGNPKVLIPAVMPASLAENGAIRVTVPRLGFAAVPAVLVPR